MADSPGKTTMRSTMRSTARRRKAAPKPQRVSGPGPGAYMLPDGVGKQPNSRLRSPESATLGTGPARESLRHAGDTPGPGAYKDPPFGSATVSTRPRSPEFSMRGREAFGAIDGDLLKANTPGPGAYGRPKKPSERDFPKYSLAKRTWRTKRRSSTPGPGRYPGPSSFGRMPLSTTKSNNEFSFQMSTRPPLTQNSGTIGPGEYAAGGGVGKQTVSGRRTEPAFSFGTGSRFAKSADMRRLRAGPGSYQLPGAIGYSPVSGFRSAPAPSLGGRHAFGSPYG